MCLLSATPSSCDHFLRAKAVAEVEAFAKNAIGFGGLWLRVGAMVMVWVSI